MSELKPWHKFAGAFVGVIIIGGIGAAMSDKNKDEGASDSSSSDSDSSLQIEDTGGDSSSEDASDETEPVNEDSGPATEFGDGKYEVGVDIEPGQYKTAGPPEGLIELCTYSRHADNSGDSLITFDSTQGPASVTLEEGIFFDTSGGCEWTPR